ncbi:hypothetical protein ACFXTO_014054 [Malus domestica]
MYLPNFLVRQLGYLQGCPVPLLSLRSVLSRIREPGYSEKECHDAKKEFQERCRKFHLRPVIPESLSTDTFGDWWEEYTQSFFSAPVEDIINKIFDNHPHKALAPQPKEATQGI